MMKKITGIFRHALDYQLKWIKLLSLIFISFACTPQPQNVTDLSAPAPIYPDYTDITIPYNIAPLNFLLRNEADAVQVTLQGANESWVIQSDDHQVCFPLKKWHQFMEKNQEKTLGISIVALIEGKWVRYPSFQWTISKEPIDGYLSYRLIEPAYEVWNEVEIRERNIENFDEKVLSTHENTNNACMNCHIYGNNSGDLSMFHLRGPNGGTILNRDGQLRKLTLKNQDMISATVYGDFHPSGRFGVFSTNIIIPSFHAFENERFEVYDTASDLVITDFDENRLISSPLIADKGTFETFPTFSPNGKYVYFCTADSVSPPKDIEQLKYSLCRIAFDTEKKQWGEQVDTLWNAREMNGSVCHPKISPDGKYLLYTVADYGTFPIWHRETELQMMNLQTGAIDLLENVNSDRSETYHSWSSNSRWFVFASKRGDGQYGKPYFCYVDEQGQAHKPFVLPQKYPDHYDLTLKSFNIPDLSASPTPFDAKDIGRIFEKIPAEVFQ